MLNYAHIKLFKEVWAKFATDKKHNIYPIFLAKFHCFDTMLIFLCICAKQTQRGSNANAFLHIY